MPTAFTYGDPATAAPFTPEPGARAVSFFIFNTDVHLIAYLDGTDEAAAQGEKDRADAALIACRDRCRFFERTLSRTRADSDIARAHAAAPSPVPVAPETCELVELAQGYCARSQGLFDITMGTVTQLWDFHTGRVPSARELADKLPHVDWRRVRVDRAAGTLALEDPEAVLDLGGIAKGYIADDLAGILRAHGVGRFVLNLGGNVLVAGGRPEDRRARPPHHAGDPWRIGIVNPFDPAHHRALVDLADGSVVTSGAFERSFARGGRVYHHILSPRTGMPAETDVASATIVAARSLDCDGYSTTAFMLGAERARDYLEGIDQVEAVIITDADEVLYTSGLEDRLALIPTLTRL